MFGINCVGWFTFIPNHTDFIDTYATLGWEEGLVGE